MKKRLVWLLAIVLLSLVPLGCSGGSYKIISGSLTTSNNSITGNYTSFTGHYFKSVKFNQGDVVDFHLSIHTDSGEISIKLLDSAGQEVAVLDADKAVKISKTGSYKVQAAAQKHKGSFLVAWSTNGK